MDIKKGFFDVKVLQDIEEAPNLYEAKSIALRAVENQPNAKQANTKKALGVINKANSKKELLISLSNFMLAHQSEGLSMRKGEKKK